MLNKPKRRQLILAWAGLVAAWVATVVVVRMFQPGYLALAAGAGGALVLAVGAVVTWHVRTPIRRAAIRTGDLRPRRERRR